MTISDAVDALDHAVSDLRMRLVQGREHGEPLDLTLVIDQRQIRLDIEYYALVDQARAAELIRDARPAHREEPGPALRLVIGDRIVAGARGLLRDADISWFDRRGHLSLSAPGLRVEVETESDSSVGRPTRTKPITGRVGLATAVDLLLSQPPRASVRETARRIGAAASTVSVAMSSLREEGVIDRNGVTDVKALFWLTAAEWSPTWTPVGRYPDPAGPLRNPALQLRLDDPESAGWALSGDYAAAHLGAPIGLASGGPIDLYVPSRRSHRLASEMLGAPQEAAPPAARLAVPPVEAACAGRIDLSVTDHHWLIARPLFVALDLAQDPGRGTEILQGWDTSEWGQRVW